ncbi:DUF2617 family protein [Halarchaeum sp. P4]|uniref:DUF2617 family protein n=1 Tax=Halarchaeum sp. P4 TaxID=3421639 RepID=UPI003EB79950
MGDTTHTKTTTLYAAHPESAPSLAEMDVKAHATLECRSAPVDFYVIGSSHAVSAPTLGFHELCSCEPLAGEHETIPLTTRVTRQRTLPDGGVLTVETRPLDAFDPDADYDLQYRFAPRAHTAIRVGERAYETYHTYPEHDRTVYTQTDLSTHAPSHDDRARTPHDT